MWLEEHTQSVLYLLLLTSRFSHFSHMFSLSLSDPDFLRHLSAPLLVVNAHTQQDFQTWLTSPWSTSLIKWYAGDWDVSVLYSLTSRHGQSHYCWQTGPRLKSQEPLSWTEAYYWPITTSMTTTTTTCFKTRINAAYWNVRGARRKWRAEYGALMYCFDKLHMQYAGLKLQPWRIFMRSCAGESSFVHSTNPTLTPRVVHLYSYKWIILSPLCEFRILSIF